MISYCGLNCNACSFRVAIEDKDARHLQPMPSKYDGAKGMDVNAEEPCPGCQFDNTCGDCAIKDCIVEKNVTRQTPLLHCGECESFPCTLIENFANDGIPHHSAAIRNLHRIQEIGLTAFIDEENTVRQCPTCGKRLSWYLCDCPDCV